ncbi:tripartite tricarboxylate transporter permease [Acidaminobacter hydrogenoformans]|uniref:Putative tricarboxylic transport membrane protein n=1 Tax=Acidaminobacter hydrogenoformans DSM 2784 TaxID=1120920 RepID=A0A1G5RZ91_9FIRM|nr:tripartite tricarboxylate transporter permease [Acidaminobacter hydrogenoformans]SCZ79316.1 putative tricarboxylic transport membrane protein [Acidaminobacter hydrogenoformans DSM 2784]
MEVFQYLLVPFADPLLLVLVAVGVFSGIYIGAIPGLSGTMAVSLLVSFTFGWETNSAIALMIGVFVGAVYGGSRSAILLNIPGAPAAVATALDGYPMALKGEAGRAMGIVTSQSAIGTLIGIIALAFFAPVVSKLAMKFSSVDYLLLGIMGMMMVGSLGSKSIFRGLVTAALGVLLGTIGMDSMTAAPRFTFGITYLLPGVNYVVAMIGLFGVAEALVQITTKDIEAVKQKIDKIIPSFDVIKKYIPLTIRSSIVGVLVGALPGAGGDIAALLTYDQAKRTVKNPEVPFGEGAVEGLIAPEAANNAAIGGAFIPMLTLGIPGDAVTAVMIGALTIHGLKPGPSLMTTTPDMFYLIVSCLVIASVALVVFGLTGIKIFTKIVEIPKGILLPIIIILSVVGSYAINNSLYDIFWMLGFGVLGYFLKRFDYPVAPAVLGIILTKLLEENYRRGILLKKTLGGLFGSVFTSPITFLLFLMIVVMFTTQTETYKKWKQKKDLKASA